MRKPTLEPTVKLLSEPTNYAVVHLPTRNFPGVVVQGDSLNALISELEEALKDIANENFQEAADIIADRLGTLRAARARYEKVCRESAITLPYPVPR